MPSKKENTFKKSNQIVEEAYRVLRTNIQFSNKEEAIKTIAIASFSPSEGRTTIAVNLAGYMAKAGNKVLFIDADLKKPSKFEHLGMKSGEGLKDILASGKSLKDIDCTTNIENLYFLSSGSAMINSSDLLNSINLDKLLADASLNYDYIILDTPPFSSTIDSAVIASKVNAVILTAVLEFTKSENLVRMKRQLERVNANILGIVINRTRKRDFKRYFEAYNYLNNSNKSFKIRWHKKPSNLNFPGL